MILRTFRNEARDDYLETILLIKRSKGYCRAINIANELNVTKRNGLDYIGRHSACEKLVVVDAVRPAVESSVIDRFFALLDEYDAVACARKITDSLGRFLCAAPGRICRLLRANVLGRQLGGRVYVFVRNRGRCVGIRRRNGFAVSLAGLGKYLHRQKCSQ